MPVSPRPAPRPEQFFQYGSIGSLDGRSDDLMSEQSAEQPLLSRKSILNVRYVNGQGSQIPRAHSPPPHQPPTPPPPPPMPPGDRLKSLHPPEGMSESRPFYGEQPHIRLAGSKMNQRYDSPSPKHSDTYLPNGNLPNGNLPNGDSLELSQNSGLNRRYSKKVPMAGAPNAIDHSAKQEIMRRHRSTEVGPRTDRAVSVASYKSGGGGWSDMDRWVDNVFDPILTNDVDGLSDARALENRMKGGGDRVLPTQPVSAIICL